MFNQKLLIKEENITILLIFDFFAKTDIFSNFANKNSHFLLGLNGLNKFAMFGEYYGNSVVHICCAVVAHGLSEWQFIVNQLVF